MGHGRLDHEVAKIGRRQHGLIHRRQAAAIELTSRMIRTRVVGGRLEWVNPTVLRICGVPATGRQELLASVSPSRRASSSACSCASSSVRVCPLR